MCGIAGFQLAIRGSVAAHELKRRGQAMARIIEHRGPDGLYSWADDQVMLAHARLAVIDTTEASDQPIHAEQAAVHLIFNGEIYNFRQLRRELVTSGYTFRSDGDGEVILQGYLRWGERVFSRLVGMFAIAIWDDRCGRLILARDRFGEKPLAFAVLPEGFAFGSEVKALLTWPGFPRKPNLESIHHYLTFGYVVGRESAFQGVERLPPAHFMVVENGKPVRSQAYWKMPDPSEQRLRPPEELKEELIARLTAAVEGCLIADVPVGALLSGGVDSSAVVAMSAGRLGRTDLATFSSGFGFSRYDESGFAKQVADRYGTSHHAFRFDGRLLAQTARLAWHYDEPFSDSSAIVAYALAQETRKHVTVALTGDGADESFLGYQRYFRYGDVLRQFPGGRRYAPLYRKSASLADARRAATDAYGFLMDRFRELDKIQSHALAILPYLQQCSYDKLLPFFTECAMHEETAGRLDMGIYLPDDLLVKMDIAAMSNSLETRAPFLNHELVEFAARIPPHQRIWGREGKALLKKALETYLPNECLYREKMGFSVPVAHYIQHEVSATVRELLLGPRFQARNLVRPAFVEKMLDLHISGREDHGTRLWALTMLELWYRTWIDSDTNQPLRECEDPFFAFGTMVKDASS
jgi:asparagine synthase (glutamine-hydrolysing)